MSQPPPDVRADVVLRFDHLIGSIGRLLTAAVGVAYVAGMLTVNLHLGRNGFHWLGLFEPIYLIARLWALLITLMGTLILVWAQFIFQRVQQVGYDREIGLPNRGGHLPRWTRGTSLRPGKRLGTAVVTTIICGLLPWLITWSALNPILFFGGLLLLTFGGGLVSGEEQTLSFFGSLLVAWAFGSLIHRVFGLIGITFEPSGLYFIAASAIFSLLISRQFVSAWFHLTTTIKDSPGLRSLRLKTSSMILSVVLLSPAYFAGFAFTVYRDIPIHLGGGQPSTMRLLVNQDEIARFRAIGIGVPQGSMLSDSIRLYMATPTDLMIRPSGGNESIVLHRAGVEAIVFSPSPASGSSR